MLNPTQTGSQSRNSTSCSSTHKQYKVELPISNPFSSRSTPARPVPFGRKANQPKQAKGALKGFLTANLGPVLGHSPTLANAPRPPPISIGQLASTLKKLPDRACGPDAISTQLLRNAPPHALPALLKLIQEMEATATLPTQLQMSWRCSLRCSGCKGLFRSLKRHEMPFLRPHQALPREERMPKRISQWGDIWQVPDRPILIPCVEQLIGKGQEEARQMKPLAEGHIWHSIKQLALKAPGIGFDFLKALPFSAMADLKELFHSIEATAMIPSQWGTSLIALLPKSQVIKRPIALVATMYCLWCRLRNGHTKSWAQNIEDKYPWERAVPGTECLQVALKRAFMTEHHQAHRRTVVSVLLDMSNFYDRICWQKLATRWLDSSRSCSNGHAGVQRHTHFGS